MISGLTSSRACTGLFGVASRLLSRLLRSLWIRAWRTELFLAAVHGAAADHDFDGLGHLFCIYYV